ncbi:hypothetical protein DITRI_Ditri16bG0024500 [Diplodiscus trichospermus]
MFGTQPLAMAEEFMMLKYVLITSNAWFIALTEGDRVNNRKPLFVPGCRPLCYVDSFEPILQRNKKYLLMGTEIGTADEILVNTFPELEHQTLGALNDKTKLGLVANALVYPIGPLARAVEPGMRNEVLSWLDMQPKEPVVYVGFGSGGTLSAKQTIELAWGLEICQRWIFVSWRLEFKSREYCQWCSNDRVANVAEQKMNATMLAEHIGVATWLKSLPLEDVIGRSEIEAMVRKIMVNKEGEAIRAEVKMLKSWAMKALSKGGSSYNSLANMARDWEVSLKCQNVNKEMPLTNKGAV